MSGCGRVGFAPKVDLGAVACAGECAVCGDGIVDVAAGETCEPGSEMPCATGCDDGDPCTEDLLEGSASQCNASCTHRLIVDPLEGDGCCPKDANALEDSDCAPVCGNQAPESGESCDPCPESCSDSDPCTTDIASGSATSCNVSCAHTQITASVDGDACCPSGADAASDSDCSPNCGNGSLDAGEECDGGPLCRTSCTWRFHPSLIHRYSFEGPSSGSLATRVVDSIGASNGTVIAGTLDGDGKVTLGGGSYGGYIDLPDRLVSVLTNVTIEAWVSWRGGAANQEIFDFGMNTAGEGSSSGSGTSFLFASPSGLAGKLDAVINATATANDLDASTRIDSSSPLPTTSTWQIVVTFSDPGAGKRKTLKLYRNGSLVSGTDDDVPARTSSFDNTLANIDDRNVWIGRANYPVDRFAGTVYEFRIYNDALSADEVASSYAAGTDPSL